MNDHDGIVLREAWITIAALLDDLEANAAHITWVKSDLERLDRIRGIAHERLHPTTGEPSPF